MQKNTNILSSLKVKCNNAQLKLKIQPRGINWSKYVKFTDDTTNNNDVLHEKGERCSSNNKTQNNIRNEQEKKKSPLNQDDASHTFLCIRRLNNKAEFQYNIFSLLEMSCCRGWFALF